MIGFLLVIILIILFFKYAVPRLLTWFIQKKQRDIFNQFQRQARDAYGRQSQGGFGGTGFVSYEEFMEFLRGQTAGGSQAPAQRRKKIDPSVGEYVQFEEIEITITETTTSHTTTSSQPENQVEDAEWEEL